MTIPACLALTLATAAAAATPPAPAAATPSTPAATAAADGIFTLGSVEVVGNREQPADLLPARLDAETLRDFDRRDLAAALPLIPGVTLINVGDRNEALVSVRGFDSRQVPLFLDGVPVYVPYDGNVDLRRFSTGDVAFVSVAKGFSSVLYGPNALGGAINVVSRRPHGPLEGSVSAFAGENGLLGFDARVGAARGAWYAQAYAGYETRDSYELSSDFRPVTTENGGERENSSRRDRKASFKLGYTPNATDEYAIGASIQKGEKDNPPYAGTDSRQRARFWRWPQWDKTSVYYVSTTQVAGGYVKPRLYYDTFLNTLDAFDNATYTTQTLGSSFRSIYDDYTWGASIEGGLAPIERHTPKAAVHFKRDVHREHNVGQAVQTMRDETMSLALEDTWQMTNEFSLVGGVSLERRKNQLAQNRSGTGFVDFPDNDNSSANPQLGAFYSPVAGSTFHATVARKTRFPTLKDRYSYRMGQALPNPTLRPERALHYELGYEGQLAAGVKLHATAFLSDLSDAIIQVDNVAQTPAGAPLFQLQNFGRVENKGYELGFDQSPVKWLRWSASYTRLMRRNETAPSIRLTDTPQHRVLASIEIIPLPWLAIQPAYEYATDRYSTSYGIIAPSYAVAHVQVRATLPQNFTVSVGVNNVFDRNYFLREGYPEAGREFSARVDWTF